MPKHGIGWLTVAQTTALGNKDPSSLDPLAIALKRQQDKRKQLGCFTGVRDSGVLEQGIRDPAAGKLQDENRIGYSKSSPPKLQGTVEKLPPPTSPLFLLGEEASRRTTPNKDTDSE